MNKQERISKLEKELAKLKATTIKNNIGLAYWTKHGFKVTQTGLKYTSKTGKIYDAVKGITKDGKEMLLKSTRNGNIFVAKDF